MPDQDQPAVRARDVLRPLGAAPTARDRLIRQAAALFMNKGLGNVSMEDVAAEVGLSLEKLRVHFPSFDALLAATVVYVDLGVDTIYPGQRPRGWGSFAVFGGIYRKIMHIPGMFEFYSDAYTAAAAADHPAHEWVVMVNATIKGHMREAVLSGIEDGDIVPDVDIPQLHNVIQSFILGMVPYWRTEGQSFSLVESLDRFQDGVVKAYATEQYLANYTGLEAERKRLMG